MLDKLNTHLRPRTSWEALDLGFALARTHFWEVLQRWCLVFVPFWLLLALVLKSHPVWYAVAVWWLKPWYARIPLWVLSQRLFGYDTSFAEFRKNLPKLLFSGNWFLLTFGRFSFWRAFTMPVRVLERTPRKVYSQRVQQLMVHGSGTVVLSMMFFLFITLGFLLSGVWLIIRYLPNYLNDVVMEGNFESLQALLEQSGAIWTINVAFLIGITFTEIFYVGGGFGVYLNSRTIQEGWDIEVSFRSLAQRIAKATGLLSVLVAAGLFGFATPADAKGPPPNVGERRVVLPDREAEEAEPPEPVDRKRTKTSVEDILKHEDFKVHETEEEVSSSSSSSSSFNFSPNVGPFMLTVMKVILYAGLVFCVGMIAYFISRAYRRSPATGLADPSVARKARIVAGISIAPEELPRDIRSAARQAMLEGKLHEALRLLYAGSLRWMVDAHFNLRESDTEGDCLAHWQHHTDSEQKSYFRKLTDTWILSAYASRVPRTGEMENLIDAWPFTTKKQAG